MNDDVLETLRHIENIWDFHNLYIPQVVRSEIIHRLESLWDDGYYAGNDDGYDNGYDAAMCDRNCNCEDED